MNTTSFLTRPFVHSKIAFFKRAWHYKGTVVGSVIQADGTTDSVDDSEWENTIPEINNSINFKGRVDQVSTGEEASPTC